jgi:hypothetical protein
MVGDAADNVAQIGLGIDVIELGGLDQAVDVGSPMSALAVPDVRPGPGADRRIQ